MYFSSTYLYILLSLACPCGPDVFARSIAHSASANEKGEKLPKLDASRARPTQAESNYTSQRYLPSYIVSASRHSPPVVLARLHRPCVRKL